MSVSPVFSTVSTTSSEWTVGRDPHGAVVGQVVDDRVVDEVGRQLEQERLGADGGGQRRRKFAMVTPRFSARGRSVSAASSAIRDRSTRARSEGALVGAAEDEQGFGEVDRSAVDDVEAVDQLAVLPARIVSGNLQQGLRDRQRGAQFVGGIGSEPLLFGDVGFESGEHGVEGVGKLAELVAAAR